MSNNNFSRRRRGMRFRPKGGFGQTQQKPDREAVQARADVVTEQGGAEHVFENGTRTKSNAPKTSPPACRRRERRKT